MKIVVGLGNPGKEYLETRHNTGRIVLNSFQKKYDFSEWKEDKKLRALVSEGVIEKEKVMLLMPETFMNKSGESLRSLVKNKKTAENLIVVYDDLDIPLGNIKIVFNRSSGGHKGIESIIKNIKTEAFMRVRIGISPSNIKGVAKKPKGEKNIVDFIIGKFKKNEKEILLKVLKNACEAIETIIKDGREKAMGKFNV